MAKAKVRKKRKALLPKLLFGAALVAVLGALVGLLFWRPGARRTTQGSGPGTAGPGVDAGESPSIALFYSCDIEGRLAPSPCEEDAKNGVGGIARMASVLAKWTKDRSDRVLVDVGNSTVIGHDAGETINAFTFSALDRLGYDVINCGENEAALSLEDLRNLSKDRKFKLISANLVRADTRAPVFPMYDIVRRRGKDIAFIGLLGEDITPKRPGKGVRLINPAAALKGAINVAKDSADYIVVLAYLPVEDIYELARKFPEVNVFLGGLTPVSSAHYELAGHRANPTSVVAYLGDQGCTLGRLEAAFPKGKPPRAVGTVALLDASVPSDPPYAALTSEFTAALSGKAVPGAKQDTKMPCTSSFVGSEVCKLCHIKQFYSWQATAHAGAYVTLLQKDKHKDPDCLVCHSTGYGMPGGFDPDKPATDAKKEVKEGEKEPAKGLKGAKTQVPLQGVGCECCHGGARHHLGIAIKDRFATARTPLLRSPAAVEDCRRCHTGERPCREGTSSDPYERNEYMEKIKHWE